MIRGLKRTIETPSNLGIQASIHNRFDFEVVNVYTGKVKQTAQAENVICNNLWTQLLKPASYFNYVFYGEGSGTPSPADTSLFSHIGYKQITKGTDTYNSYTVDFETGICSRKALVQLEAAEAVGRTISEVGIGYGTNSSNLCTHAVLKDMNGNPISIQKTDTDVINIYVTIYVHFERLGYDNNTIFLFKCRRNTYMYEPTDDLFAWLSGDYFTLPKEAYWTPHDTLDYKKNSSSNLYPESKTKVGVTYSADITNRRAIFTLDRLEASSGNYDQGLNHVSISGGETNYDYNSCSAGLVYSGGSSLPYSVVTSEAVATGDGVTTDFALDFAFPHDARVFIDGAETSDFTLDYAPSSVNWIGYMKAIHASSREGELVILPQNTKAIGFYAGASVRFYNPMWEIGISAITFGYIDSKYLTISASDDNITWENLTVTLTGSSSSDSSYAVPIEYAHKKFWMIKTDDPGNSGRINSIVPLAPFNGKCLHLNTPPAEGAVITADYKCDCFAKDANHVLDMTITIQLNEYTEAQ